MPSIHNKALISVDYRPKTVLKIFLIPLYTDNQAKSMPKTVY
jgi:hypothetical protein